MYAADQVRARRLVAVGVATVVISSCFPRTTHTHTRAISQWGSENARNRVARSSLVLEPPLHLSPHPPNARARERTSRRCAPACRHVGARRKPQRALRPSHRTRLRRATPTLASTSSPFARRCTIPRSSLSSRLPPSSCAARLPLLARSRTMPHASLGGIARDDLTRATTTTPPSADRRCLARAAAVARRRRLRQILLESVEIAAHTVGGSTAPYMAGLNEANLSETDSGWTIDEYCRLLPSDAGYIKGERRRRNLSFALALARLGDGVVVVGPPGDGREGEGEGARATARTSKSRPARSNRSGARAPRRSPSPPSSAALAPAPAAGRAPRRLSSAPRSQSAAFRVALICDRATLAR